MNKKKIIILIATTILLISAILYQILYKNYQKNEIISEVNKTASNIDVQPITEVKEITVFVDVSGEVKEPGLYELKENARVNDAILAAGGVTEDADLNLVNLAYILSDEMKITIPKKEIKPSNASTGIKNAVISSGITPVSVSVSENLDGKVNINTASKGELETLTGIGSSIAERIVDYRKNNGSFKTIEEIKNVSGIGEAKYNAMKDKITV